MQSVCSCAHMHVVWIWVNTYGDIILLQPNNITWPHVHMYGSISTQGGDIRQ